MATVTFTQRPDAHPTIYAYEDLNPQYKGLLKVGYTEIGAEKRVAQQYPTKRPDGLKPYRIVLVESAMKPDGSCFTDHEVHAVLKKRFRDPISQDNTEFFRCKKEDVKAAILAVRTGTQNLENRTQSFGLRPEQREAIDKTMEYFASAKKDQPDRTPKFLWNAKMRFGKTFAAYKLAQKMGCKKVLVLTFKPAVEAAWEEDLMTHIDFEGWQFICRDGMTYEQADLNKPFVCFGSFQDYLGTNDSGGIKAKNEWVHTTNWDLVIFDEYHFGAWRENAKKLFEIEDEDEDYDFDAEKYKQDEADNAYNETFLPITTAHYLFLSGTPFRALNSGEFIEEQIYNWTYSDEQRAKEAWGNTADNPYRALPRMVLLTYKIPEEIRRVAEQGEFNEFDLNVFFSAKVQQKGKPETAKFVYENEVQKWLDLIRGAHMPASMDDLKLGRDKRPPMPYSDARLLNVLSHTLWFMPNVASCFAMANLLKQKQNNFYHEYKINVCAGTKAGIGVDALGPVQASMGDPLETKTITLSCGKLTTGVTVRPWTGIFMLRNLKSPETYFQAAFRVQSPWEITTGAGTKEIMKHECYVFDFALDRALKQISSYSIQLHPHEANPEKSVAEFINFLPVLAYDGSSMKQVDAQDILDIAMAGTSATLLAKRWQSALLVNVDNETLARLMANEEAMVALMKIEGFRSLNADIETIINKSEAVKKAKEKGEKLTPKEKKEISDEEKEFKSKRKEIQEKLIKFATRVPIFMYLTDYRERSLKDVITQLEPGLFKKVTGLDVKDFELLVSLNVFNAAVMNPAVYNFKRYEDASLSYTGIDRHEGEDVGGWDTVLKRKEYETLFYNQQATMKAATPAADDLPDEPYVFEPEDGELEPEPVKPKKKEKKEKKTGDVITYTMPVEKPIAPAPMPAAIPITPKPIAQEPAKKVEVDTSKIKVGTKVRHNKFGEGEITKVSDPTMTVRFAAGGEKTLSIQITLENGIVEIIKAQDSNTKIFVYGTLMRGEQANNYLSGAEFVGAYCLHDYAIYNLGSYPGIRPKMGSCVFGEVYEVNDEMLRRMDRYEGEGSLYHRTVVSVERNGETLQAAVYVYAHSIAVEPIRGGKWNLKENDRIWYGCYGSNLCAERFACYIKGGRCRFNNRTYKGCANKTMWTESKVRRFNGELYFANISGSWKNKGVAFYDPDATGTVIMRLYRITWGQLRDVQKQEGDSDQWYGRLVPLGLDENGIPIYTFTSKHRGSANPPDASYLSVIKEALVNECGVDKAEADRYLHK